MYVEHVRISLQNTLFLYNIYTILWLRRPHYTASPKLSWICIIIVYMHACLSFWYQTTTHTIREDALWPQYSIIFSSLNSFRAFLSPPISSSYIGAWRPTACSGLESAWVWLPNHTWSGRAKKLWCKSPACTAIIIIIGLRAWRWGIHLEQHI